MRYGIVADSISIHALREEGDKRELHPRRTSRNFYPRPPRGGRPINHAILKAKFNFYPRPPRGGRLQALRSFFQPSHFYPRPPRGGRRICHQVGSLIYAISIHALREEGDPLVFAGQLHDLLFLSTPSARRATPVGDHIFRAVRFLSTPSARRATPADRIFRRLYSYFYPRPPRGGRPQVH